jgi:hydroxymethylbilane synthase
MRIGTRASALALAQTAWVAERIRGAGIDCEIVHVTTAGDRDQRRSDKSRWVSELERALLAGEIDVAVHSAKDVPAELDPGTELAAITTREDPRDALCGAGSLDELSFGARVGTSSLRRAAQLRALRVDLEIVELRGNVDTRLRKLAAREADAIVLALAGLRRLGREREAGAVLDPLVPAAGQGALALQCVAGSATALTVAGLSGSSRLSDPGAWACVTAERALTAALGASCQTAVGAHAAVVPGQPETVELRAWVGLPDGSEWISDRLAGAAAAVGGLVAERMLAAGAGELLARAAAGASPSPSSEALA